MVGLPYSHQGQMTLDEIADGKGERQPGATELAGARFQGELIARTANKRFG